MSNLYLQAQTGPVWPYSIRDLRLDNPRLSFSLELPNEELAQLRAMEDPILVWRVAPTSRPADTREQRWIEAMPEMMDGAPVQRWAARPATAEELAAWDAANQPPPPAPPQPDWLGFAGWLYVFPPIADAMAAARASTTAQGEPATTGLATALQDARLNENYPVWRATWGQFLLASGMAAEPLSQIVARAIECNLPAEFIATLAP